MAPAGVIKFPACGWELLGGDCLRGMRAMPDGAVDHVITDPPYSEHVHTKSRRGLSAHNGKQKRFISEGRELGFEHLDLRVMRAAARHFGRLARRWVLVFSDIESTHLWRAALEAAGLEYIRTGLWDKIGGAPQFTGDRPAVAAEAITIAHRPGLKRWNGGGKRGIWSYPIAVARGDGTVRYHTAQKPELLMDALVRDFTEVGDLVLDPFAGSGTTGVSAIRQGRRFIGYERDEAYLEAARRRLGITKEQLRLFEGTGS